LDKVFTKLLTYIIDNQIVVIFLSCTKGSVLKKLKDFTSKKDLLFQDIDVQFLENFHANFRAIRAWFYKAIDAGLVQQSQNPFFSFKLKSGSSNRIRLTEEEIKIFEKLKLPENTLTWHVRNAFMFAFYTAGMRVSDIITLKWSNIQNGRLIYQMHKTGKMHSLKLPDKARKILSYYGPKEPCEYVFPFFSSNNDYADAMFLHNKISAKTALINKYLKLIATKAEINKKISTHTARHSFADIARKKTNNIYNLSKTLGHSDLKITEAYLASFDEEAVDNTLDEVFK
jgi:integrase